MLKWAVGLALGVALGGLGWVYGPFLLPGGLTGACGDVLLSQVTSPDQRSVAHVVQRNCGATTPYVTLVFVTGANRSWRDKQAEQVAAGDADSASVAWRGRTLVVTFPSRRNVRPGKWSRGMLELRYDDASTPAAPSPAPEGVEAVAEAARLDGLMDGIAQPASASELVAVKPAP